MEKKVHKKTIIGQVVSDRMQKTIVIRVERKVAHPKYKKIMRYSKRYKIHDEKQEAKIGQWVKCIECRPLSKEKNYRLVGVVERTS